MSGQIEDALASLQAEMSATQQIVKMLLVQHSLNRSRSAPTQAVDELERDFARILSDLSRGTTNAAEKRHFKLVETSLAAQLDSARRLAAAFAAEGAEV